jgi:acylphosphatase
MNKRLHAMISGRVQNVGYRNFVEDAADVLNLTGWVRNLYSGDVEVMAEGDEGILRQFSGIISTGPSLAHVNHYTEEYQPATGEFRDFTVRANYLSE